MLLLSPVHLYKVNRIVFPSRVDISPSFLLCLTHCLKSPFLGQVLSTLIDTNRKELSETERKEREFFHQLQGFCSPFYSSLFLGREVNKANIRWEFFLLVHCYNKLWGRIISLHHKKTGNELKSKNRQNLFPSDKNYFHPFFYPFRDVTENFDSNSFR